MFNKGMTNTAATATHTTKSCVHYADTVIENEWGPEYTGMRFPHLDLGPRETACRCSCHKHNSPIFPAR